MLKHTYNFACNINEKLRRKVDTQTQIVNLQRLLPLGDSKSKDIGIFYKLPKYDEDKKLSGGGGIQFFLGFYLFDQISVVPDSIFTGCASVEFLLWEFPRKR